MRSSYREEIVKRWDALHHAISDVLELSYDVLTVPECLALLERHEFENRRLPQTGHALINHVARQADPTELGGTLSYALANRLRISRGEAGRRIREDGEPWRRSWLGCRTRQINGRPALPCPRLARCVMTGDG